MYHLSERPGSAFEAFQSLSSDPKTRTANRQTSHGTPASGKVSSPLTSSLAATTGSPAACYCRQVPSPNPEWAPGSKQHLPFEGTDMTQLDPAELGAGMYPFIISAIVPRPIAFISSLSKEAGCSLAAGKAHSHSAQKLRRAYVSQGKQNLSPYSYFGVM